MGVQINYISCFLPLTFDQNMKLLKDKESLVKDLVLNECVGESIDINPFSGLSFKVKSMWAIDEIEFLLMSKYGIV